MSCPCCRSPSLTSRSGLKEWGIMLSEKCAFLKHLVNATSKAGQTYITYHYRVTHVRSLDSALQATQLAGLNAVASS
ncbi:hypothetical protein BJY52DRAFT_1320823 [Lactarius psammicola]|nr:hypothetical protein BJY52DRAFT_1320823 [Lactarius psammicola]